MTGDGQQLSSAAESERERLLREKAGSRTALAMIVGTLAFLEFLIILQLVWR